MTPVSTEQVVPAVIVVIAHANAGSPAGPSQTGLSRDVGKGSIPVIFVEVRGGGILRCVGFSQTYSVRQIDIQPAIVVIVEESQAAALYLDQVFLGFGSSPHIGNGQSRLLGDVHIDDR